MNRRAPLSPSSMKRASGRVSVFLRRTALRHEVPPQGARLPVVRRKRRRPKPRWIDVGEEALDDELRYLRAEIYRYPDADTPFKRLTAFDRFRA